MSVISQECPESSCSMMYEVFWRSVGQTQKNSDINGRNSLYHTNRLGLFLIKTGNLLLKSSGLFERNNAQFKRGVAFTFCMIQGSLGEQGNIVHLTETLKYECKSL